MSLVGTLGKIAIGVMVAKGVGSVIKGASGGGGLGGALGGALGGNTGQRGNQSGGLGGGQGGSLGRGGNLGGGLGGAFGGGLGSALSGGTSSGGLAGGLGGLLGGLAQGGNQPLGNQQDGSASGGLSGGFGGGLGGLLGGDNQQGGGGGLGGLLDSLGGQDSQAVGESGGLAGGLGGLLNGQLGGFEPAEPVNPSQQQEEEAKVLITAMLNAAKSDGNFDPAEQEKIVQHIGELTQEDADFINTEIQKPLNVREFINSVPRGMEQQVYLMSLMAIDLDHQAEAQYLDQLAKGLNISNQQSNEIHTKLGVPALYS